MLYAAAALSVASVVVGNWQHSYSPFFLTERRSPEDFLVYYRGARAFWREHNFYETMIGVDSAGELPYSYPPSSALFFTPLAWLPSGLAWVLFEAVSLASLWWALVLTLRRCNVAAAWRWALVGLPLALWIDPVHNTFHHGQINLVLMALVITDLWWESPRRKYLPTGVLTGAAAAVKITPAIFGLYFIATRNWKAIGYAAGTGGLALLVAYLARPAAFTYYFTTQLGSLSGTLGPNRSSNQSARSLVVRYIAQDAQGYFTVFVTALVLALGVAAIVRLVRASACELAAVCTAFTGLLIAPITWQHHYVWAVPLCILLIHAAWRNRVTWPVFDVLVYLSISTVFIPHRHITSSLATDPGSYSFLDIAQSSLVLWAIATLAACCVRATDLGQLRNDASGTPSPAPAATEREVAAALSDSKDTDRD